MSLYITKLTTLNQSPISALQGSIEMEQLGGYQIGDTSYSPSTNEKTVFFVNENGYDALRGAIGDDCDYYVKESKDHAASSMTTIMITAIVSIIAIVIIGLIITPILSKSVENSIRPFRFS